MSTELGGEEPGFLTEQLVTYIGNKRALLPLIDKGISLVRENLQKKKLKLFDVFSGSGIVSRYMKHFASDQYANDLEFYASVISSCYLANQRDLDLALLSELHTKLLRTCSRRMKKYLSQDTLSFTDLPGFISDFYAPKDMNNIQDGERCFYTPYNACYLDCMRQTIDDLVPHELRHFFIAPLLSEASIHANTGGVFKGFYKDSSTGRGKFGGNGENALSRIQGKISLPFPVFSRYRSRVSVFQQNANDLAVSAQNPRVDIAYIDPPYNQHPYGSNYFMLNLIATYMRPDEKNMSKVSGIPREWNRSSYNQKHRTKDSFLHLASHLDAKYLLISFNNEGFISEEEMMDLLPPLGKVTLLQTDYNTFRASRNLSARAIKTKEYLYVLEKKN